VQAEPHEKITKEVLPAGYRCTRNAEFCTIHTSMYILFLILFVAGVQQKECFLQVVERLRNDFMLSPTLRENGPVSTS